jgi:molybdopterin synthase catalytic subunit
VEVKMISIIKDPIDVNKILIDVKDDSAGATSLFLGHVRNQSDVGTVYRIYYEAYKEMAEKSLVEIEREVLEKWPVKKFIAIHRIGDLSVGEISVAVAVSSKHRKEAFEACRYGIDAIKIKAPIWKKEISDKGELWAKGVTPR